AIGGNAGEAILRAGRAGLHFLPDVASFTGHGDADAAELATDRDATVALGREARIAGDVAGDQERAGIGSTEPPLHRLRSFGKAERDCRLLVDPRDRRTGDQARFAKVLGTDTRALERVALGKVVPLRH